MFSTLKTIFKWSCYEIYKIYLKYIKNICDKFISQFSRQRIQKVCKNDSSCFFIITAQRTNPYRMLRSYADPTRMPIINACDRTSEHRHATHKNLCERFKLFFIITTHRTNPYCISRSCVRQTHVSFTGACDCTVNNCTQLTNFINITTS